MGAPEGRKVGKMRKPKKKGKNATELTRSARLTLKFANQAKLDSLALVRSEYLQLAQFFVDQLWDNFPIGTTIPGLLPKDITDKAQTTTWLSARMIQACGKQASGIVRGCRKKHEKRLHVHERLIKEGQFKRARKLAKVIEKNPISKPELKTIEMELDERFVTIDNSKKTSFDSWITLSSIGNGIKIPLPFKRHKHFNQLATEGRQLKGIRVGEKAISICFEIPKKPKASGKTIGIDVGMGTAFATSDGCYCDQPINGHTIASVCNIIARKKRGSKGHKRACAHRRNLIGYYNNQIDWSNIQKIKHEDIKYLRYKKRTSRYLGAFVYREFFGKLEQTAERLGVQVETVCPTYTSQRCSCCGWTRKKNRRGKLFRCGNCGFTADADFNAAQNVALDLRPIGARERQKRANVAGFFWQPPSCHGQAPTVPAVQKT